MLRDLVRSFGGPEVAVDLGTAFVRVARRGVAGFAEQRSALPPAAPDSPADAGRWYPALRRGVIVDIGATAEVLARALGEAKRPSRVLLCVPSDATDEERAALCQAARAVGARSLSIVPEPVASARGAGLDMSSPHAQLLVDVGDGVTDLAVFRSGEMVSHAALRVACSDLRDALAAFVRATHAIELDPECGDLLVRQAYACDPVSAGTVLRASGWRGGTRDPVPFLLSAGEVLDAVADVEARIVRFVVDAFRALPDETAVEVIESGLCLTGGGALLPRLVRSLRARTGLDVRVPPDPLHAVIKGARAMLA